MPAVERSDSPGAGLSDSMSPIDAVAIARAYVDEIHPDAGASILGGSAASGRATPTSDLDIAVLYADGHANYAETTRFRGWLVEAFVHTPASLAFWYEKRLNPVVQ